MIILTKAPFSQHQICTANATHPPYSRHISVKCHTPAIQPKYSDTQNTGRNPAGIPILSLKTYFFPRSSKSAATSSAQHSSTAPAERMLAMAFPTQWYTFLVPMLSAL